MGAAETVAVMQNEYAMHWTAVKGCLIEFVSSKSQ